MTNQAMIDLLHATQPSKVPKTSLKEVVASATPEQIQSLVKLYSADPVQFSYLNRLLGE